MDRLELTLAMKKVKQKTIYKKPALQQQQQSVNKSTKHTAHKRSSLISVFFNAFEGDFGTWESQMLAVRPAELPAPTAAAVGATAAASAPTSASHEPSATIEQRNSAAQEAAAQLAMKTNPSWRSQIQDAVPNRTDPKDTILS